MRFFQPNLHLHQDLPGNEYSQGCGVGQHQEHPHRPRRALQDADAAVINTNYALSAGLSPKTDSIAMEKADSPYANVIAVRKGDEEQPWLKTLVEVYHSPEIKNYIETKYEGAVIPAW